MKFYHILLALVLLLVAVALAFFSNPDHVVDGSSLPLASGSRLSPQFDGRDTSNLGTYFRSAATGLWMFRTDAMPSTPRKAAVVLVHGFSEHHQRYSHVIEQLVSSGYSVHGYDHQGHGRSEGTRGYVKDFKTMDDDLTQFIDLVASEQADVPIVLFGHSMGAMLSVRYLSSSLQSPSRQRVQAAFMSAPGLKVHPDIAVPWKISLARTLSTYIPKLPVPPKMPTDRLYTKAVHERDTDPLNNLIGTRIGFAVAYLKAVSEITDDILRKVDVPVYALHSLGDLLCEASATKHFQSLHSNPMSTFVYPEHGKHELLQETDMWKSLLSEAISWIDWTLKATDPNLIYPHQNQREQQ